MDQRGYFQVGDEQEIRRGEQHFPGVFISRAFFAS